MEKTPDITTAEYSVLNPIPCPKCGGRMSPAEYYVAVKGDTTSKTDLSQAGLGKVTTTYSTQYRNIRRKTGGFCINCYTESRKKIIKEYYIFSAVLGGVMLGCLALFLVYLFDLVFHEKNAGLGFAGLAGTIVAGYYAIKHLMSGKSVKQHIEFINSPSNRPEHRYNVSAAYVQESKDKGFCEYNEVLLSAGDIESMKSNSRF
ncbi:MAG: hypothetical protein IJL46_02795 [Clostridia bacterium]|nr:hypothetical protein [Clostridia bacterium]MBQ5956480.1 hypothetical protein [Clostridia bacterium]